MQIVSRFKEKILIIGGGLGGAFSLLVGGFSVDVESLLILMALDYSLGSLNTLIYKTSPKTADGKLSSKQGFKGIFKKTLMLSLLIVGNRIDISFGLNYAKGGICTALIINEVISILETYKLSGLNSPKILDDILEVINKEK